MLGTFGKVNALWSSRHDDRARPGLLDELLPLAAERAGGLAWEYYFTFDGGKAPWVSSLAQGTALQALARAATRLEREPEVLAGHEPRAWRSSSSAPPEGVRVPAGAGAHYAQYSFEPGLRILNGFIQSLVGLYDYGRLAGDARAPGAVRDRRARAPARRCRPTTPARGRCTRAATVTHESDLGYHTLLRDFLDLALRPHARRDLLRRRGRTSRRT